MKRNTPWGPGRSLSLSPQVCGTGVESRRHLAGHGGQSWEGPDGKRVFFMVFISFNEVLGQWRMYEKLKILYVIGVLVVLFWKMKPLHVFGRVEVPVGQVGPRCWDHSRKRLRRKLQRKKKRRKKRKRIRKPRMERQRMERMERKSERKSDQWASVASVPAPFLGQTALRK